MFPILAFMVTMMAVMPHICHAQPPTTGTWPPTLPKLTQGECPVSVNQNQNQNQSDDVREQIREAVDAAELRRQFLQVLQSRRSAEGEQIQTETLENTFLLDNHLEVIIFFFFSEQKCFELFLFVGKEF